MELISITQASVLAMIQVQQWDPFGKALNLEVLDKMRGRYIFAKAPTKLEEVDFQKGVELQAGKFGDVRIDRISIFFNGIIVDTRSSTEDSEKVLYDILDMAREAFGATIQPARLAFTSKIMFRSEMRLTSLNPALPKIADQLTERATADLKHPFAFEPTAILMSVDTSQAKIAPVTFSIERRAEVPFAEKTYFSSAPLRTAEHLEVVRTFEASLLD